jgi:hypothetical protein
LYANLCQKIPPPNLPWGYFHDTGNLGVPVKRSPTFWTKSF